jgi:transcriptional regulator with XRE-family HTH domain
VRIPQVMTHDDLLQRIGRHLRRWRMRRHLTQAAIAAQIGTSPSNLSQYEHGGVDIPTSQRCRLALALNVTLQELVDGPPATAPAHVVSCRRVSAPPEPSPPLPPPYVITPIVVARDGEEALQVSFGVTDRRGPKKAAQGTIELTVEDARSVGRPALYRQRFPVTRRECMAPEQADSARTSRWRLCTLSPIPWASLQAVRNHGPAKVRLVLCADKGLIGEGESIVFF